MKRRNFMLASSGLAGSLIASVSRAAVPCPPPIIVAGGTTSVSASCPVSGAGGGSGGSTALAKLAASMASGSWADFTMGNLTASLVYSGTANGETKTIIAYSTRAVWDPVHKKIHFWGIGHGNQGVDVFDKLLTWDDSTNQWSSAQTGIGFGHGYAHLTVNPANGDLYHREYNSRTVSRKPHGGAWTTIASMLPTYNQVAGALSWFPELHGGVGGLIFVDQGSVQRWNPSTNTWALVQGTLNPLLGPYGQWSAYANGSVYVGGGNGSNDAYRVTSAATLSRIADTPFNAGEGQPAAGNAPVCAHPNGTDLLLFQSGSSGQIHRFNGSSWSSIGTHSIGKDNYFFTPIPEYGIVLFVCQNANAASSTPNCRIYKP